MKRDTVTIKRDWWEKAKAAPSYQAAAQIMYGILKYEFEEEFQMPYNEETTVINELKDDIDFELKRIDTWKRMNY